MPESAVKAGADGSSVALGSMKDSMMNPQLVNYHGWDLPPKWFYQIISFLRIDDPAGFVGRNQTRNWISRDEEHVRHFLVHVGDILIAHA